MVRAAAARVAAARAAACRSSRSPGNGSSQFQHDPRTSMSKPNSCMYFLLSHNAGNTQPAVVAAVVVRHSLQAKACARPFALGSATATELIYSCESARGATPEVHPRVGLRLSRTNVGCPCGRALCVFFMVRSFHTVSIPEEAAEAGKKTPGGAGTHTGTRTHRRRPVPGEAPLDEGCNCA